MQKKEKISYRFFISVSSAILIFFFLITIFGEEGLLKLKHLYTLKRKIEAENIKLLEENLKLKDQLALLKTPQYNERMIREQLGYIKKNEWVLILDESQTHSIPNTEAKP